MHYHKQAVEVGKVEASPIGDLHSGGKYATLTSTK